VPYHYGTAFGLEVDGALYLVTAAHVLAKDPNNSSDESDVGLVFSRGALVDLAPYDQIGLKVPGEAEAIDVVAIQPKNVDLRLVFSDFFKEEHFFSSDLRTTHYLAACGFPETKNRRASWAQKLAQRPYAYFGRASDDAKRIALDFNKAHFCLDFAVKWTFKNGLAGYKAPDPHGISGGPVLVVHDIANPQDIFEPRLVGIGIETRQKMKCFVCVDIRHLTEALAVKA